MSIFTFVLREAGRPSSFEVYFLFIYNVQRKFCLVCVIVLCVLMFGGFLGWCGGYRFVAYYMFCCFGTIVFIEPKWVCEAYFEMSIFFCLLLLYIFFGLYL